MSRRSSIVALVAAVALVGGCDSQTGTAESGPAPEQQTRTVDESAAEKLERLHNELDESLRSIESTLANAGRDRKVRPGGSPAQQQQHRSMLDVLEREAEKLRRLISR